MTEEEEIQDELLELQILSDGLYYEWSKKPAIVNINLIHWPSKSDPLALA